MSSRPGGIRNCSSFGNADSFGDMCLRFGPNLARGRYLKLSQYLKQTTETGTLYAGAL